MKWCRCACVAALALFAAPGVAAGITYDCDTAANHFSELVLPAVGPRFTVSGTVQLNAIAESAKYVPLARVQISAPTAPGQASNAYAGFALSALPANAKKTPSGAPAVQMLSYNSSGNEDEVLPLSMMAKPGTRQPFTLSYDGSTVTVTLGNEIKSFSLKASEPVVRIVCSTGEFLFTDLTMKSSE